MFYRMILALVFLVIGASIANARPCDRIKERRAEKKAKQTTGCVSGSCVSVPTGYIHPNPSPLPATSAPCQNGKCPISK